VASVRELRQGIGQRLLQQALVGDGELTGRTHDAAALALNLLRSSIMRVAVLRRTRKVWTVSGLTSTSSAPASMASMIWPSLSGDARSRA
jgi:hypothetical protein